MRLKLLRRRLTISAPRMAVRSAMPWPLRWAVVAIVLGFCGAIALWAFEFGKEIAGLDSGAKEELVQLRADMAKLREERDKAQSIFNTSASLLTAEKAAQEKLTAQIKTLESENRALRDDLGFFEKLIPAGGAEGVAIRGLQAEVLAGTQVKWQVLVIQPVKDAPEFRGKLELTVSGALNGKPWSMTLPGGPMALQFRQYRRVEGMLDLPPQAVVRNVSAKLLEGAATRAVQTVTL
ncbi:DUF6776 family protein [Ramlibacter sp.]|uniref:DUF6776 family protein n=1 Tax=Ramlibacter sp. TaxID=1917967 RepID=UPI003D0D4C7D